MKKITLIIFLITLMSSLYCQILDDLNNEDKTLKDQVIQVKYEKKSAALAMAASAVFPGAGQFYVNKKSIAAYIYPIIEIGLWTAYFSNNNKGDDITSKYKKYADANYARERQAKAQESLINLHPNDEDIYTNTIFTLDAQNSQHFYEDIGKYDKYVFGWSDWYNNYVVETNGSITTCNWTFDSSNKVWLGNRPILNDDGITYDKPYSALRADYIDMRQDAEAYYSKARTMNYLLVFNHMISTVDAIRVTKKYNKGYLASHQVGSGIKTAMVNNQITPMFNVSMNF